MSAMTTASPRQTKGAARTRRPRGMSAENCFSMLLVLMEELYAERIMEHRVREQERMAEAKA